MSKGWQLRFTGMMYVLMMAAVPAQAQLGIGLKTENLTYLLFEPMKAVVTINNVTDETLVIGNGPGEAQLRFNFHARPKRTIKKRRTGPVTGRTVIKPGQKKSMEVDLVSVFQLSYEGQYQISAILEWDGDGFTSKAAVIDIVPGLEVLSMQKHVPNDRKRLRTYSLRYLNRAERLALFLSIYDEREKANYGVFDLGSFVRVTDPYLSFDAKGFLKVVHQSQPRLFTHSYLESNRYGARLITQEYYNPEGQEMYRKEEKEPEPEEEQELKPTRDSLFDLLKF